MEKMEILAAHDLIVPLQRFVENNISQQATWNGFDTSMREICREAESRHITVHLRLAPSRPPRDINEAMQFINRVGTPNLRWRRALRCSSPQSRIHSRSRMR